MPNETQDFELPEDIFQREAIAQSMCELICESNSASISPIALHGPWGCGKSTHALRMQKCIQEKYGERHKCLYWNAAQADFAANPLPMLVSVLYAEANDSGKLPFQALSLKLCCSAAFTTTKTLAKVFFEKQTGINPTDILEGIKNAGEEADKEFKLFKQFLEESSSYQERIQIAQNLIDYARGEQELVIIIDELDRCRPDFALKLLEDIKHLFTSDHCKFILVMNKNAMSHSISHIYGLPIQESEVYLDKLIKLNLHLPNIVHSAYNMVGCSKLYFEHLLKTSIDNTVSGIFTNMLIEGQQMQLREIEKWISSINILVRSRSSKEIEHDDIKMIITLVTYIASFKPHLLVKLIRKETTAEEVLEGINYPYNQACADRGISYCKDKIFKLLSIYLIEDESLKSSLRQQYITDHDSYIWVTSGQNELSKWLRYSLFLK